MTNKQTESKFRIEIAPEFKAKDLGRVLDEAKANAWSDDPGHGKAVLLKDERGNPAYEVHNPIQFAPAIGFEPTPPIEQLIRERVRAEFSRLKDDDVIDSPEDAEDFDIPDELPLSSVYEVVQMQDQAPRLKEPSLADRAKAHVDFMELAEREKLTRKRAREHALQKQEENLRKLQEEARLYGDPPPSSPDAS